MLTDQMLNTGCPRTSEIPEPGDRGNGYAPRSDEALVRFVEFTDRIRQRLQMGKRVYGDSSFDRPLPSLVEQIRPEVLDAAGWAFILYERLEELGAHVKVAVELQAAPQGLKEAGARRRELGAGSTNARPMPPGCHRKPV